MASCKFTICSQKGDTPLQGEEQLQSSEVQGKRQDDCDQQQWQDGSDQMQRQADGEEGEEKDGSDQGRQNGGDQGRQAGGDRDKQPEPCQGQEMQQQIMAMPSQCYDVIFQGDNVDKNVHVRDMRVDNPNTSLHYFNMYAVKDRVPCPSSTHDPGRGGDSCYEIEGAKIPKVLRSAPCTTFLPSVADCKNLRDNYIHIVATVLVENFTFLHQFKACIPLHLKHKYSDHMAKKSEIVSQFSSLTFPLANTLSHT